MADNVNHPSHYETGQFECIDVMVETQGIEAVQVLECIAGAERLYRFNTLCLYHHVNALKLSCFVV